MLTLLAKAIKLCYFNQGGATMVSSRWIDKEMLKRALAENPFWKNRTKEQNIVHFEHMLANNKALTEDAREYIRELIQKFKK